MVVRSLQAVGSAPNIEPEVWSFWISQTGKWRGKLDVVESKSKWEAALINWSPTQTTAACETNWSLRLCPTTSIPNTMGVVEQPVSLRTEVYAHPHHALEKLKEQVLQELETG